jgi:hypothetical protein
MSRGSFTGSQISEAAFLSVEVHQVAIAQRVEKTKYILD